jgi:hypothetical protein
MQEKAGIGSVDVLPFGRVGCRPSAIDFAKRTQMSFVFKARCVGAESN